MQTPFKFVTDTSTLAIFDVASLRHRLEDDADWWVYPESAQVEELNAGHAAFVDLGADGQYSGTLRNGEVQPEHLSFVLSCPSGQVFLGAAEETTSDGMEPDCTRGGLMLSLEPGVYQFSVALAEGSAVYVGMTAATGPGRNEFGKALRLAPARP
jgi:hypothetical protein